MKRYVFLILVSALALLSAGCQRDLGGDNSTIEILTPRSLDTVGDYKTGALEAYPADRTLCFFVNVTYPKLESQTKSVCSPKMGIFSQMVVGGSALTLNVDKGSARNFELYVYLAAKDTKICPEVTDDLKLSLIKDTYLVGNTANVSLSNPEENITITASFPGLTNNIIKQLNMPSSCNPPASNNAVTGLAISTSQGIAVSPENPPAIKMTARVGRVHDATTMTGGSIKLKVNYVSK